MVSRISLLRVLSLLLERKSLTGSRDHGLGLVAAMIPAVMTVGLGNAVRAFKTISPRALLHWVWANKKIGIAIAAGTETETITVGIAETIDASIADTGSTEMIDSDVIVGDVTVIRTRIQMRAAITGTRDEAEVREM